MSDEKYFKTEFKTDNEGNVSVTGVYDLAGEMIRRITEHQETLYKHFCRDVCEKMVEMYHRGFIDMGQFRRVFNDSFDKTVKEWMDAKRD